ncbi:MAG: hypothetical protein COA97_02700 [Flavobacteriales bacterium]|nr:MAG: hypothetical protein COA97_02700 [Flavobacteriales bacterium]
MNWFVIATVCIMYPLFGFGIYLIRNRLKKIHNFNYVVFIPIGLSFVLGLSILAYALQSI